MKMLSNVEAEDSLHLGDEKNIPRKVWNSSEWNFPPVYLIFFLSSLFLLPSPLVMFLVQTVVC